MNVKVMPGLLKGAVDAIPSKSQAHRALICAALADEPTHIECKSESEDIAATIACLTALGAKVKHKTGGYIVYPLIQRVKEAPVSLPCKESGSTFRFLLPIVGALGQNASFDLQGRLPKRPLTPLYEELVGHGCELSPQGSAPFHIAGQLTPGDYSLDAGVSSQFISGLLFALPMINGDSILRLTGRTESFPYIELTMAMLELFGIQTGADGVGFSIPGGQTYRSPGMVHVEGDWSNAAFWLCAGAIGADGITCTGLDLQSRQGDRAIMDILEQFGAHVEKHDSSVNLSGGKLHGTEIDAGDIPDLVPIMAVVGAAAEGNTVIRNAGRLRTKESDRLAAVTDVLRRLGADVDETAEGLVIRGGAALKGGHVSSWEDHRIAMSAAIAATVCTEPVVIDSAEAINKSYPGFFDDLRLLGGQVQVVK